jgi:hypothetical protein
VVPDVAAARQELLDRGVEVGDVQEFPWGRFVFFNDPDGNGWSVQELPSFRVGGHPTDDFDAAQWSFIKAGFRMDRSFSAQIV